MFLFHPDLLAIFWFLLTKIVIQMFWHNIIWNSSLILHCLYLNLIVFYVYESVFNYSFNSKYSKQNNKLNTCKNSLDKVKHVLHMAWRLSEDGW
jgi:hypothetical protein